MKTFLIAAGASLSLGMGIAYAGDGDVLAANTQFSEIPGVIAEAPVQHTPALATAQNGRAVDVYATQSSRGTWLSQDNANQGANS